MASKTRDPKGWRILFTGTDGKRRTIRLGCAMTDRGADDMLALVEVLARAGRHAESIDGKSARRLAELPDHLHAKLAAVGLVEPRVKAERITLSQLWDRYLAAKTCKPTTKAVYDRVRKSMEAYFGKAKAIDSITVENAEGWVKSLSEAKLAPATRSKLTHVAKALFRRAVLWELLTKSPFAGLRPGPQQNAERKRYVPLPDLEQVLAACPSHEWKCIFGLARLAGLRCPSEVCGLRWSDVNFETGLMTVRSPKTAHHAGGDVRTVPMSPRLRQILTDAFTAAAVGATHVVPRSTDSNLGTYGQRIIKSAKVIPWPKTFVNLRGSCETDWAKDNPAHVCAAMLGHSITVAAKHYMTVRPEDYQRVVSGSATNEDAPDPAGPKVAQKVAQNGSEPTGITPPPNGAGGPKPPYSGVPGSVPDVPMGATGLEHPPLLPRKTRVPQTRGSKSGSKPALPVSFRCSPRTRTWPRSWRHGPRSLRRCGPGSWQWSRPRGAGRDRAVRAVW